MNVTVRPNLIPCKSGRNISVDDWEKVFSKDIHKLFQMLFSEFQSLHKKKITNIDYTEFVCLMYSASTTSRKKLAYLQYI